MTTWIWEQAGWPQFSWNEAILNKVLVSARAAQSNILGAASLLDASLKREAISAILVEDSVQTSAIENENLNIEAVRSSVAKHLGLPSGILPTPSRAIDGLVEVLLNATQCFDQPLTLTRLCGWQAALFPTGFSGMYPIQTGSLRGETPMQVVSGKISQEIVHFLAPPHTILETSIDTFLLWFQNTSQTQLDGLVRAGIAHLWFITLHPFEDGNGRLARAITDMAIAQDEKQAVRWFSLSSQIQKERNAYYDILEHTQKGSLDITEWLVWFLQQIKLAAEQANITIARVLFKARFWLQMQEISINARQRKVLNRLLDTGPHKFEGGMNNRKYVHLTKTSRATAQRELAELVGKGCLILLEKKGRSTAYDIPWDKSALS